MPLNRLISFIVLVTFFANQVPAHAALNPSPPMAAETKNFPSNIASIKLPSQMGKIEEAFQGNSHQTVVVIQDAHAIPDAQKNIQKIIGYFQKQYGVRTVGLEGASAQLDPQIFQSFPNKELLRKVFSRYLSRGELTAGTGAAIFSTSAGNETIFHGVEDWGLYEQGLGLYLAAMKNEAELLEKVEGGRSKVEGEKKKIYSEKLFEIDQKLESFRRNETDLVKVIKALAEIQRPEKGTELSAFLAEIESEGQDNTPVEIEVKRIAEKIKKSMVHGPSTMDRSQFNAKYQEFQTARISAQAFALYLKEWVNRRGAIHGARSQGAVKGPGVISDTMHEGPAAQFGGNHAPAFKFSKRLSRLMAHQKRLRDIEGTKFFRGFEHYTQSVKGALFENEDEKILDEEGRQLFLLEKLAKLELSREEWRELKASEFFSSDVQTSVPPKNKHQKTGREELKRLLQIPGYQRQRLDSEPSQPPLGGSLGQNAVAIHNSTMIPKPAPPFTQKGSFEDQSESTAPPNKISENLKRDLAKESRRYALNIQGSIGGPTDDVNKNNNNIDDIKSLFKLPISFYENAEKRDEAFLKNLMRITSNIKLPTSNSLLIAGGFHAHGLTQRLKAQNISYLLVMPQIGSIPENTHYREHMKGDVSWKKYFEVENGKINLYKAFVRGTRDKLLDAEKGRRGDREKDLSPRRRVTASPRLLKQWRDQIIRNLAEKRQIEKAGQYTKFIDEVAGGMGQGAGGSHSMLHAPSSLQNAMARLDRFIAGLRKLQSEDQLTEPNIVKLLKPATIASVTYGALAGADKLNFTVFAGVGFDTFISPEMNLPRTIPTHVTSANPPVVATDDATPEPNVPLDRQKLATSVQTAAQNQNLIRPEARMDEQQEEAFRLLLSSLRNLGIRWQEVREALQLGFNSIVDQASGNENQIRGRIANQLVIGTYAGIVFTGNYSETSASYPDWSSRLMDIKFLQSSSRPRVRLSDLRLWFADAIKHVSDKLQYDSKTKNIFYGEHSIFDGTTIVDEGFNLMVGDIESTVFEMPVPAPKRGRREQTYKESLDWLKML